MAKPRRTPPPQARTGQGVVGIQGLSGPADSCLSCTIRLGCPATHRKNRMDAVKLKAIAGITMVVSLFAVVLTTPVAAQDGDSWYTNAAGGRENKNDNPQLHGPRASWSTRNPSGSHGYDHHGDYHFTYGTNDATRTNWATWEFQGLSTSRDRIYDVWVWVPRNHATAEVRYHVHLNGCTHVLGTYPVLDQHAHGGWVKIGRVSLGHISNPPSNDIVIEVNDNDVADPNDSSAHRSIGIDAVLLVRDSGIGWDAINSNHLITDENCLGGSTGTVTSVPTTPASAPTTQSGSYDETNDSPRRITKTGATWYLGSPGDGYGRNNLGTM